jgi:hypothetical protein
MKIAEFDSNSNKTFCLKVIANLGFSDADGMFESCGSSSQAKDLKLGAWMISTQVLLSCPRMRPTCIQS